MERVVGKSVGVVLSIIISISHPCCSYRTATLRTFLKRVFILFLLLGLGRKEGNSRENQLQQPNQRPLAELSPEELARIEVTTVSRRPEKLSQAPAAVYV